MKIPFGSELLDAALHHFENGLAVLAVTKSKAPYTPGWNRWFERPQTRQEAEAEFSNGAYGVALLTSPATPFVVLDFDGPHASAAWEQTGIELPEAARNYTPSGGVHLIYRLDNVNGLSRKVRLVKAPCDCLKSCGVDFLVNGFFVIPPTPGYKEDPDAPFEDVARLPDAVIRVARESRTDHGSAHGFEEKRDGSIPRGERNSTLASLAGSMRWRGMSFEAIFAALKEENAKRCEPPLHHREIERIARSISGYEPATEPEHLTDLANAKRLVRLHGHDLRFCSSVGWLVWDGRRWAKDDTGEVERRAKGTVQSIYAEAAACTDDDRRKALAEHARRSESRKYIDAMIHLARSEPGVGIRSKELDRDSWLLNVENGTLNLKTGELRDHRREDFITKLVSVSFDPTAECPRWREFLKTVTGGDADLEAFLQRAAGYSLSGSTREQVLFILYGLGLNGKSTFINELRALLGEYGLQTRTETLLIKRGDSIPNDVARLAGARFISAVETEGGKRLAESLVKQLTGGDAVSARFLHREYFEFEPTFKLWLAVNHKPRITGTDHAIWRRIRLAPFTVIIPKIDPDFGDKLKQELAGVLGWAVDGCIKWQRQGLAVPEAVKQATAAYRNESDLVGQFVDECCELNPDETVSKAELYERYAKWTEESGERALRKNDFGSRMAERGFKDDQEGPKRTRVWLGITLR